MRFIVLRISDNWSSLMEREKSNYNRNNNKTGSRCAKVPASIKWTILEGREVGFGYSVAATTWVWVVGQLMQFPWQQQQNMKRTKTEIQLNENQMN